LQDPDANVRRAVARALANMQVAIAILYWFVTLTSLDPYLRFSFREAVPTTAVSALGKLQVESAIPQSLRLQNMLKLTLNRELQVVK
jgi:HEAT repeat protein